MHLLTGEEWKVLDYAVRRIMGFHRQQRRISLTQFSEGTRGEGGKQLDHGTGICRPTVVSILKILCGFNLIVKVADEEITDPRANAKHEDGQCYALQLDSDQVDDAGLELRAQEKAQNNQERATKSRKRREQNALNVQPILTTQTPTAPNEVVNGVNHSGVNPINQQIVNGVNHSVVNGVNHSWLTPLTTPYIRERKTEETQRENQCVLPKTEKAPDAEEKTTRHNTSRESSIHAQKTASSSTSGELRLIEDLDEAARPLLEAFLQVINKRVEWQMGTMSPRAIMQIARIVQTRLAKGGKPEEFEQFLANFPRWIGKAEGEAFDPPKMSQWADHFEDVLLCQPRSAPVSPVPKRRGTPALTPDEEQSRRTREEYRRSRFAA